MESQFLAFRNTNPLPPCVDSPFDIYINGSEVPCSSASCNRADVQSHCPATCGTCSTYQCEDSDGDVLYQGSIRSCVFLAGLPTGTINNICGGQDVEETCRDTCGYCT